MRDIYDITVDEVIEYVEGYGCRFSVLLSKRKDVFGKEYYVVPSWLKFQVEMVRRGKRDVLEAIEDIDHRFWANKTEDEITLALAANDLERLKALQLAMQVMIGQDKLDGSGNGGDGESHPTAMTINISGVAGKKEKEVETKRK